MASDTSSPLICVKVSALEGGHLTLPEKLFVTDPDPDKRATVPSMCFLIQHPSRGKNGKTTNVVLDLGVTRDLQSYMPAMQAHIANRQPVITSPDTAESLQAGGLDPGSDIDVVMLSHVHWDHVGTPADFSSAKFVVGSGTLYLLQNGAPPHYPKEIFDPELLPKERTYELPPVRAEDGEYAAKLQVQSQWKSMFGLPAVLDYFGDGSVLVVDCPGHLRGHINLLLRVQADKWVYLGGDCCHDIRILRGEKGIALYDDGHGQPRSVHMDTDQAANTLEVIKTFLKSDFRPDGQKATLEVLVAHDGSWREANKHRFFPGALY